MTRITKKRNVMIAAALLLLIIIAGIFTLFNKENKIKAGAESHTSPYLYFTTGAYVAVSAEDMYKMRFDLNINKAIMTDNTAGFIIYIGDRETGASIAMAHKFGDNEELRNIPQLLEIQNTGEGVVENAKGFISITDFSWGNFNDSVTWRIRFYSPLTYPVCLTVEQIADDGTVLNTAVSDKRTLLGVLQNAYESEASSIFEDFPHMASFVNFAAGEANEFRISNDAFLSQQTGVNLLLNIPKSIQEELEKDEEFVVDKIETWVSTGTLRKKYLVVTRAESLENYNEYQSILSEDDGYKHFWYTLGGETIRCEKDAQHLTMYDDTVKEIFLPVEIDSNKTYYYYAQVVEVVCNVIYYHAALWGDGYEALSQTLISEQKTSTYYETTMKSLAETLLKSQLYEDESYYAYLQEVAGVTSPSGNIIVEVNYMSADPTTDNPMTDIFGPSTRSIYKKTSSFSMSSVKAYNKYAVWSRALDEFNGKDISIFNVIVPADNWMNHSYGSEGEYRTGDRIILQALGYEYEYNSDENKGVLNIIYEEFRYSDFAMRITNDDPRNNLIIDVFTPHVSMNSDNTISLIYNYNEIETFLYRACGWMFEMKSTDMDTYRNEVEAADVTINKNDDNLVITFPKDEEGQLLNVTVTAVVEIFEDFYVTSEVEYIQLSLDENNDIVRETVYTEQIASTCGTERKKSWQTIYETYGSVIDAGVKFPGLIGVYMEPVTVQRIEHWNEDETDMRVTYKVIYNYHTLFKLNTSTSKLIGYVATNNSMLTYNVSELLNQCSGDIPDGYRVQDVSTSSNIAHIEKGEGYTNATIKLAYSDEDVIVPVIFTLTDKWLFKINYMQSWTTDEWITPFATKVTKTVDVSYTEYPDMMKLTSDDVAKIMGYTSRDDLMICGIALPYDDIEVTFDGIDTYTTTLEYGSAYIKSIGVNGEENHINVPLTSFTEWATAFWPEDSTPNVLMLNTPEKQWFKAGDVRSEDIYGYFAVAVFDTKVSDLDSHFQKNTGDGCMNIYATEKTKGSLLYQFFDSLRGKGIITNLVGEICMSFCEIVNDANAVQYAHFFYLDGSSENPYISIGGANDYDDNDGAGENWGEDIGDEIGGALEDLGNTVNGWFDGVTNSPLATVLGAVCGVVIVGGGVAGLIWVFRWAVGSGSSGNKRRRR